MYFDLVSRSFLELHVSPDKLAVSGSDKDLNWRELYDEVCKRIGELSKFNLKSSYPVILVGSKQCSFIVNIIACIAMKVPYIPVDSSIPQSRLNQIKEISKASLIIDLDSDTFSFDDHVRRSSSTLLENVIYVIFTSGSTGVPKGVQITHDSLIDFSNWLKTDFKFDSNCVFMNQASFSFDLSVYELVGFMASGGTVILTDNKTAISDPLHILGRIQKYRVNTWVSTPSYISRFLLSSEFNKNTLPFLHQFVFCGEVLPSQLVSRLFSYFPDAKVINSYGPTEATVSTTRVEITDSILQSYPSNLPVGYVKGSSEVRILEKDVDGVGEIQIIGPNVSVGYIGASSGSSSKFSIINGSRSFRTGDYGFFIGHLLFFSDRKDDLVKLNGFRIELGDIDSHLCMIGNVSDSVTLPLSLNGKVSKLISFVILSNDCCLDDIKGSLSSMIPAYMVPSEIIAVDEFPYNSNFKIDKKELIKIYKTS